ncbi:MAG: NAD(P)/FAD-dependent oxidoreductase [Candidatus Latescibacteria bacterium]|nr:NAD(P)/FAD-dependent oxidoreductase [Candidatus Latescibacterota bacterium]
MSIAVEDRRERRCDVLVVGAGAAGLFAALAARGGLDPDAGEGLLTAHAPGVVLLNNEARLGLKILVSGGGRCNLTNAQVDENDYESDAPRAVKGLLRGFPAAAVRTFFRARGCPTYTEPMGKVFPQSDSAADVLGTLLGAVEAAGIPLIAPAEVTRLDPPVLAGERWLVRLGDGSQWQPQCVVIATGGKSLPKTGSRGFGLQELERLGHRIIAPLPALTPLLLRRDGPLAGLSGLTVPAVLTLAPRGMKPEQLAGTRFRSLARAAGGLLVTHKGATGPAPFDVSGACGRAQLAGEDVVLYADFWSLVVDDGPWLPYRDRDKQPGAALTPLLAPRPPTREAFEHQIRGLFEQRERILGTVLATRLPRSLVEALLHAARIDSNYKVKQLDDRDRARWYLALTQVDLGFTGTEGYAKAEVTSGGVPLGELDRRTLESKLLPGLYCCGEVINVTGRLGGFNFQWAWSSGYAAGIAAAKASSES